jgi:hypothetical protein
MTARSPIAAPAARHTAAMLPIEIVTARCSRAAGCDPLDSTGEWRRESGDQLDEVGLPRGTGLFKQAAEMGLNG